MGNFPKKEIVHGLIELILRTLNYINNCFPY